MLGFSGHFLFVLPGEGQGKENEGRFFDGETLFYI